ncbi:ubiquitin-like activating enzyme 2 isoform X2 [Leptinotarsa decemlineata]|uniref:ubiquitin-like activating enzyme 2 isoform X2 n=1 Tax=Leptinotarsa decemlineata TaxID=7539 RepID=UPI000C252FAD|nr:SUMO-activating enzyme subunit 2-like isoform X2 [Leptinotarsa decemlineata]
MTTVTSLPHSLSESTRELIPKSKVLVVGAGGIGCEVLKNLALSGFEDIEIIDLDTIDVSNLNRQFLFRKEHVGKPKAAVARESILSYNPNIKIKAYHDSITSQDYGVNFFKRFILVLNALDNRGARNHVNRMCLAADVPLIESGTSGYSGQVELIKKGVTQCYECQPKAPQKTFPGCTIRNTPSEPVHCIVWAKHLFNQLFGEEDPDQDVSPDTEDPEAKVNGEHSVTETGNIKRTSTRQWAQEIKYDPAQLFDKFFKTDIEYLLKMENLWKNRKAPVPLSWKEYASYEGDNNEEENSVRTTDMQVWTMSKCAKVFSDTVSILKEELSGKSFLVWDKDDKPAMDFITACANIRAHIFSIPTKSRFAIKSIAGNIIPAIATANAMIAGLVVLHAFRVIIQEFEKCPSIYLRKKSIHSKFVLASDKQISKANPTCYVCSPKPFVNVFVNVEVMTVKEFETEVLKKHLNMVAPDAVLDGKGMVVISSEEGETEANDNKKLNEIGIVDGSILKCDDFLQNYELTVAINHYEAKNKEDPSFKVVANPEDLKAKEPLNVESETKNGVEAKDVDSDDDLMIMDDDQEDPPEEDPQEGSSKRRKLNPPEDEVDEDLCIIES